MSQSNNVEVSYILTPIYEQFLLEEGVEGKENRGYKHFHPSAFGGCLRKIILQYFGEIKPELKEPREIKPSSERIFKAGHAHHFRMQEEFSRMGIIRGYWRSKLTGKLYGTDNKIGIFRPQSLEEIGEADKKDPNDKRSIDQLFEYEEIAVINEEYNFAGHTDGIIELEKGDINSRYVVDFKTIKSERYSILATKSRKPDPEYITQINIYMWLLGVHQGIIFYEDKNEHKLIEFHVPYDEELIDQIKKYSKELIKLIKQKKIPSVSKSYAKTRKPCIYCGYKKFCWDGKNNG